VLRELKRGGQIYFLHNDIDTINTTAERLAQLVPRLGSASRTVRWPSASSST
jgi:transcription-repair coupling factor (superfamily II helicase)